MEVTSKGLQQINGGRETAKTIFVSETPKHTEHADRLVSLRCCLGDPFGNCLEKTLEPIRFNASKNLAQKTKILVARMGCGVLGPCPTFFKSFAPTARAPRINPSPAPLLHTWSHDD